MRESAEDHNTRGPQLKLENASIMGRDTWLIKEMDLIIQMSGYTPSEFSKTQQTTQQTANTKQVLLNILVLFINSVGLQLVTTYDDN